MYIGLRHTNTILTNWFDLFYCCCNGTDWADKLAGKETIRAHVVCVLPERIRNVEEPETHGYLRAPKAKTVHHIIDRLRTRSLSTCSLSPSHPTMPCLCQVKCQIKCQWCNKYESLYFFTFCFSPAWTHGHPLKSRRRWLRTWFQSNVHTLAQITCEHATLSSATSWMSSADNDLRGLISAHAAGLNSRWENCSEQTGSASKMQSWINGPRSSQWVIWITVNLIFWLMRGLSFKEGEEEEKQSTLCLI